MSVDFEKHFSEYIKSLSKDPKDWYDRGVVASDLISAHDCGIVNLSWDFREKMNYEKNYFLKRMK